MITNKPTRARLVTVIGATGAVGHPLTLALAERASQNGWRLRIVGRDLAQLRPRAEQLNAEWWRVSELSEHELAPALTGSAVVVNLVGPFASTADIVARAALREGCHYLDVSNEYAGVIAVLARDDEARRAGIALLPAVGFGTVATEGLAAFVAAALSGDARSGTALAGDARSGTAMLSGDARPGTALTGPAGSAATSSHPSVRVNRVNVAMFPQSAARSRGASNSVLEVLSDGGAAIVGGRLTRFAFGHRARRFRGPDGPTTLIPAATGDLATIPATLGARFVTSSVGLPLPRAGAGAALPIVSVLTRSRLLRRMMDARSPAPAPKPGPFVSYSWARVASDSGQTREAWLRTGEGYDFTVHALVAAVERLLSPGGVASDSLAAGARTGALTATAAFGPGFLFGLPGVSIHSSLTDALQNREALPWPGQMAGGNRADGGDRAHGGHRADGDDVAGGAEQPGGADGAGGADAEA